MIFQVGKLLHIKDDDPVFDDYGDAIHHAIEQTSDPDREVVIAVQDCGQTTDEDGDLWCNLAGTNYCDWQCPFEHQLWGESDDFEDTDNG